MSDLEALQKQVVDLKAKLAQPMPPSHPPPAQVPAGPDPPRPIAIYILVGDPESGYLHRDARGVRRLVETVALAHGVLWHCLSQTTITYILRKEVL